MDSRRLRYVAMRWESNTPRRLRRPPPPPPAAPVLPALLPSSAAASRPALAVPPACCMLAAAATSTLSSTSSSWLPLLVPGGGGRGQNGGAHVRTADAGAGAAVMAATVAAAPGMGSAGRPAVASELASSQSEGWPGGGLLAETAPGWMKSWRPSGTYCGAARMGTDAAALSGSATSRAADPARSTTGAAAAASRRPSQRRGPPGLPLWVPLVMVGMSAAAASPASAAWRCCSTASTAADGSSTGALELRGMPRARACCCSAGAAAGAASAGSAAAAAPTWLAMRRRRAWAPAVLPSRGAAWMLFTAADGGVAAAAVGADAEGAVV